jgi:hypothetical protein
MSTYEAVHRRRVADLTRVLPFETRSLGDARKVLGRAMDRLLEAGTLILAAHRTERAATAPGGRSSAEEKRSPTSPPPVRPVCRCHYQVERIIVAAGDETGRRWWTRCVQQLGPAPIDRALGRLKEVQQTAKVGNPGGLLTTVLQEIASEAGVRI